MSASDWLLLIALSVLWGGSFYFAKIAVLEIPPLTLALARVAIAGAVLAVLVRPLGGGFPRDRRTWGMFAVLAAIALGLAAIDGRALRLLAKKLRPTTP